MSETTTTETDVKGRPTALLVIDMQRAMLGSEPDDQPAPHRADEVLANTAAMLARARSAGASVVFVRHVEDQYPPMSPGHPGFEVHDAIAPLPGEPVVDKRACDAFCDTPLAELLAERGVPTSRCAGSRRRCASTAPAAAPSTGGST